MRCQMQCHAFIFSRIIEVLVLQSAHAYINGMLQLSLDDLLKNTASPIKTPPH